MVQRRGAGLLFAVLGALAVIAPSAQAQFGRNQVQYQTFNFQIIRTEHFDVYFYPSEREGAQVAARIAERWYARLSHILGDSLRGRQPLILYASQAQFQQTNAVGGDIGEGTGGVTESFKRRIVLPFGASLAETDHVIGHELTHAFQYDLTSNGKLQAPGAANLPLWFIEGMAEYLSLGPVDPNTALWIRDAAEHNRIPNFRQLEDPRYFPYRFGQALLAYVGGRWGDEVVGQILRSASRSRDAVLAMRNVLGIEPDTLIAQWRASIHASYDPITASHRSPDSTGAAILTKASTGGDLSIGPSLSPDGSQVVFLSERSQFAIEMYLADATTGRVRRRLTRSALDPHIESVMFIYSAGAWAPDGRRFVYAATVRGRPALEIEDVESGRTLREIRLNDIDEIYSPSFSPDGNQIAFSGHTGGFSDIYVVDLTTGQHRRLTDDQFADLQPVWSPDGTTIAFATDRFGTDLIALSYGDLRLATMDVASGRISEVHGFSRGKHINPQWSQDGRSLFFLADPDGIPNMYRVALAGGALFRVTNVSTGASGITGTSPAISVAANADRAVVTVYNNGKSEVHRLDGAALAGEPVTDAIVSRSAATLPPRTITPAPSPIMIYLADAATGLPPNDTFPVTPYRAQFGLDYVAQPYLSAGVSSFGTFVGGGISMYWSSMLGDRQLGTMFQINGGVKDIAAEVDYVNLRRRTDWGFTASQIPYATAFFDEFLDTNGDIVDQQLIYRQTSRQVAAMLQYPFNRVQRFEFSVAVLNVAFDSTLRTQRYHPDGTVSASSESGSLARSITLGQANAALVFDNSLFGGTGPILGHRYRLEVDPAIGSINFVGVQADLRKYVMPVRPLTIAARVLHAGRYGSGGEDRRLFPMYLGYQTLIRGYANTSFTSAECTVTGSTASCPTFERLLGSRMLVGNIEARLPLLGAPLGLLVKGAVPPIDLVLFSDGGYAWSSGQSPRLLGGTRSGVWSYGAALRVNLFGFVIGEIAMVNPVNRPQKGWWVQLGFSPGF